MEKSLRMTAKEWRLKMNLPNKITMIRVILIPFFVFFMLTDFVPYSNVIAVAIFIVARRTATVDGYLARKY